MRVSVWYTRSGSSVEGLYLADRIFVDQVQMKEGSKRKSSGGEWRGGRNKYMERFKNDVADALVCSRGCCKADSTILQFGAGGLAPGALFGVCPWCCCPVEML